MKSGNVLLAGVLLTAALAPVFGAGKKNAPSSKAAAKTASPKIRLAVQPGDIQPYVAESLGYFKDEGLEVELNSFSYGPPIIEALPYPAGAGEYRRVEHVFVTEKLPCGEQQERKRRSDKKVQRLLPNFFAQRRGAH